MPEANMETLRRAIECFNRGEFDAAVESVHPDVEVFGVGGRPPFRGRSAVRQWLEPDAFDEQAWEPLELRASGEKVLAKLHVKARGAGSGIEIEVDFWSVWTFDEDGLVTRVDSFLDHDKEQALEAAGLQE
jgi:ketosteroid isomerase-like protein